MLQTLRYRSVVRWLIAVSGLQRRRVLGVGCGDGALVRYLRHGGWDAFGVDPGWAGGGAPEYCVAGLAELDRAQPAAFDIAVSNFSLEHCDDPVRALGEWSRRLRPGGWLFVRVPNRTAVERAGRLGRFQSSRPGHAAVFGPDSLRRVLAQAGFDPVRLATPLCTTAALTPPCSLFPGLDPMRPRSAPAAAANVLLLGLLSGLFLPYTMARCRSGRGFVLAASGRKGSAS